MMQSLFWSRVLVMKRDRESATAEPSLADRLPVAIGESATELSIT